MSVKKALLWTFFWISLAGLFNGGIYYFMGRQSAVEFLGGYIIEQSLSIDNLFLFLFIFSSFGIEPRYQRRILSYGIMGAVVLRLLFIILGIKMVQQFHWVLYVFGLILLFSGIKMWFEHNNPNEAKDFKNSMVLKVMRKIIPVTDTPVGEKFFVRRGKVIFATPLLAVLVLIEASDLIFAIDSIPAVFSVTTHPLLVASSNIFAIIGLRNMYFLLEKTHRAFHLMKYGVAAVLTFTGLKLSLLFFQVHIPLVTSVCVIISVLALSIIVSVLFPAKAQLKSTKMS